MSISIRGGGGEYVTPEVTEHSTLIEQILALIGVQ